MSKVAYFPFWISPGVAGASISYAVSNVCKGSTAVDSRSVRERQRWVDCRPSPKHGRAASGRSTVKNLLNPSERRLLSGMLKQDNSARVRGKSCNVQAAFITLRIRSCTYCHAAPIGKPSRRSMVRCLGLPAVNGWWEILPSLGGAKR